MRQSAGILLYRYQSDQLQVLLVHPGGPLWEHKDFWQIPKGEVDDDEELLITAYREFHEETGSLPPEGELIELGSAKSGSKVNYIWAIEGDFDTSTFTCNTFTMEWPPKSGKMQEFPECDRAGWFDLATAKQKLFKTQVVFIDRLAQHMGDTIPTPGSEQQSLL